MLYKHILFLAVAIVGISKAIALPQYRTDVNVHDKIAFEKLLDSLLWNADDTDSHEERGLFRRQGLLGMTKPHMFRQQDTLTGSMYRSFTDRCYGLFCSLGLSGLAERFARFVY